MIGGEPYTLGLFDTAGNTFKYIYHPSIIQILISIPILKLQMFYDFNTDFLKSSEI